MKRVTFGILLLLHALAHASPGTWAFELGPAALVNTMWALTVVAYFGAALGCFRAPLARDHWKDLLLAATLLSICLLTWFAPPWWLVGVAIDVALFLSAFEVGQARIDDDIATIEMRGTAAMPHPWRLRTVWTIGGLAMMYLVTASFTRPVQLRWGSTAELRDKRLPGDEVLARHAGYRIDHAIVIHAPPESIWPWLLQVGQDRAGFYSYDGLRLGRPSWRVTALEPNRVMALENWGTFVLDPVDSMTTRLIVRTRATGSTSFLAFALAPIDVFVFEPAHFIMERAMLRGIRFRAEHITPARRMSNAVRHGADEQVRR